MKNLATDSTMMDGNSENSLSQTSMPAMAAECKDSMSLNINMMDSTKDDKDKVTSVKMTGINSVMVENVLVHINVLRPTYLIKSSGLRFELYEIENLLLPRQGLIFLISSEGSFIDTHHRTESTYYNQLCSTGWNKTKWLIWSTK